MIQSVSNFTTKKSKNYSVDDNRKQKTKINQSPDIFINVGSKQKVSAKQVSFSGVANYGTQEDREILKTNINPLVIRKNTWLNRLLGKGHKKLFYLYNEDTKHVARAMKATENILNDFSNDAQYRFLEIKNRDIKFWKRLKQIATTAGLVILWPERREFMGKILNDGREISKDKKKVDEVYWDQGMRRIFKSHSENTVAVLTALSKNKNYINTIGSTFNEMSKDYDNLNKVSQDISHEVKKTASKVYNRQCIKQGIKDLSILAKAATAAFGVMGVEDAVAGGALDFLDSSTSQSVINVLKSSNADQFANYGIDCLRDVAKEFTPSDIMKISKYAKML